MPLHRQVGRIDLQQQPGVEYGAVVVGERLAQGVHVIFQCVVVGVLHRRGDDAGRRGGHERVDERIAGRGQRRLQPPALQGGLAAAAVDDRRHGARRGQQAHPAGGKPAVQAVEKSRIARHVGHQRPLRTAPETAHPMLDEGEEALARRLAVVADVDAGGRLPRDHVGDGGVDLRLQVRLVDRLAAKPLGVQLPEPLWPRQAAGVRGEDALRLLYGHRTPPG